MKQFDELPIEIQNRMLDCQEDQGNPRNPDVFRKYLKESRFSEGFDWPLTSEGWDIWNEVLENNNYVPFFKLHHSKGWKLMGIERLREQLDEARKVIKGKQETIDKLCLSAQRTEANHQAYIAKIKAEKEANPEAKSEIMSEAEFELAKAGHPIETNDGVEAKYIGDVDVEEGTISFVWLMGDRQCSHTCYKDTFLRTFRLRTTKREGWIAMRNDGQCVNGAIIADEQSFDTIWGKDVIKAHVTWEE